jgi:hypothetical protein
MKPINTFFQPSSRKQSSAPCSHKKLILLPDRKYRLRCRHCRRILTAETPDTGCCPGCYENDGVKRYDLTETNIIDVSFALYRCEDCGAMIHAG